jgi:hypothetical protein
MVTLDVIVVVPHVVHALRACLMLAKNRVQRRRVNVLLCSNTSQPFHQSHYSLLDVISIIHHCIGSYHITPPLHIDSTSYVCAPPLLPMTHYFANTSLSNTIRLVSYLTCDERNRDFRQFMGENHAK